MIDFSTVYLYSEQPTTCPRCGLRTEIVIDLSPTNNNTQVHKCLNVYCSHNFIVQSDQIFENKLHNDFKEDYRYI